MNAWRGSLALGLLLCVAAVVIADEPQEVDINKVEGSRYLLVLNRSVKGALECYNKELAGNAALSGKLGVRVTIEPTGQTRSVDIRNDTLKNQKVAECVVNLLKEKTWPTSPGAVFFDYNFVFAAKPKEPAAPPQQPESSSP